ncbi:MAG: NAD(P)H-dependent oxidoreductase [Gammaproteobacteria bacterium]|nr:NAD(P)H-dependent oxidoreductase [Gammaproteobacteria bacterium]
MKIAIISGSHRTQSQSEKVARAVQKMCGERYQLDTWLYSLAGNPLPFWDQGVWDGDARWDILKPLKEHLVAADAFVIVSPEWHGQVPAGLKNFFLLFSKRELGHKPALIVTVTSTDASGAYPVAELRMSSYKNNRICYIPEHVIIRRVDKVLNADAATNDAEADAYYRERLTWSLGILKEYAVALKQVRASGATESDTFKTGM